MKAAEAGGMLTIIAEGARDRFQVALRIIPCLVAILVALAMLRTSGALEMIVGWLSPINLGLPAEALPMALIRPLSGSGACGVLAATIQDRAVGPDSYTGYLVSTIQGSTETTFYVLAVYFGAIRVRRMRHALPAALTADVVGDRRRGHRVHLSGLCQPTGGRKQAQRAERL